MAAIPSDRRLDSTWAFLSDPYRFISKRCDEFNSDVLQTRLMARRTILLRGRDAARLFYDPSKFIRKGAAPRPVQKTLFGVGGIQGLDGEEHRHRKAMFLTLVTPERIVALNQNFAEWWEIYARRWQAAGDVVLYPQLQELLCRTICYWAGVPLPELDVARRTRQLVALFDEAGRVGLKHVRSRWSRKAADAWIAEIISNLREGKLNMSPDAPANIIAHYRRPNGELLSSHIAAVELINVLRPTIAVAVYILYVALALHEYPRTRDSLLASDEYRQNFVQEVRRYYPFFPATNARVRQDFEWEGYRFPRGRRVLLDLYGTNHDPRIYSSPEQFRPERFAEQPPDLFSFIPQGGGDRQVTHRCPGEDITTQFMKTALQMLLYKMRYKIPPQDLSVDFKRLPAVPKSRVVLRNVELVA